MFRYIFLLMLPFFLFGCASNAPRLDPRHDFSLKADDSHGRLVVQPFQVLVDEPGVIILHFLGALGGADLNIPYWANVYDVTDNEIRPLGWFKYVGKQQDVDMGKIEQLLPVGHRILMIDRSAAIEPDFLGIDIRPNKNIFVGIAQAGFSKNAFAVELKIRQEDYAFCDGLRVPVKMRDGRGTEVYPLHEDKGKLIKNYMSNNSINPDARYFEHFCLSQIYPAYVNEANVPEFEKSKAEIIAMKEKYLTKWLASNDKKMPFDIRRDGIPKRQPCSSEVKVCPNGKKVMRTEKNCEFASCDVDYN